MEAWEESGASGFCPAMLTRMFALLNRNLDVEEAVYRDMAAAGLDLRYHSLHQTDMVNNIALIQQEIKIKNN